jgi:hypothetical protein
MKVYEIEYRALITLTAHDMYKAALQGAEVLKDNPGLIHLRAVRERDLQSITKKDQGGASRKAA